MNYYHLARAIDTMRLRVFFSAWVGYLKVRAVVILLDAERSLKSGLSGDFLFIRCRSDVKCCAWRFRFYQ